MGSPSKIRIGIIGAGHMAKASAKCLARIPQAHLIAMASRTTEKARRLAEEYSPTGGGGGGGVAGSGCRPVAG